MKIEPKAAYGSLFLGKLLPRRFNQAAEPTTGTADDEIRVGESAIWRDTDDGKIYLVYNDITAGVVSVELT